MLIDLLSSFGITYIVASQYDKNIVNIVNSKPIRHPIVAAKYASACPTHLPFEIYLCISKNNPPVINPYIKSELKFRNI